MTNEQKKKCHAIIHAASVSAAGVGAGLAQIPFSDNAVIVPIQVAMIISLGKVFDLSISESAAMSALTTAAASTVGRGMSQILIGWIPGVGNVINASTAAGVTEAAGWIIANEFDSQ
ncbi:MAG: hypothetical protein K2K57_09965 [Oscillospiraceae bacterium]|nr:hypothetical protein [Oscillospiraceae bacterium]